MPAPHADVIKEQQVFGCTVPTSREKYHARVLVLAFFEGGWLCRQLRPVDSSEQVFVAKVGISSKSA